MFFQGFSFIKRSCSDNVSNDGQINSLSNKKSAVAKCVLSRMISLIKHRLVTRFHHDAYLECKQVNMFTSSNEEIDFYQFLCCQF